MIERLTYRSHIVETGTESYRFKHSLARTRGERKAPPEPEGGGFEQD